MTQKVVFPSDKLIDLLTEIQFANKKISGGDLFHRHPDDFRSEIDEAIMTVIRSTIHVAKHEDRLTNYPLSCDDGDMFTTWFATRLIKALTPITGAIPDGKDDAILMFLYQELSLIGAKQEVIGGNYVFAYLNGQYMVRLHVPLL